MPPFDSFRVDQDDLWLQSALTLDSAKARVQALGQASPGEYIKESGHG